VSTTAQIKIETLMILLSHMGEVLYSSTVQIINNIIIGNTTTLNTVANFTGEEHQNITKVKD
jgi:hypothetical protein